MPKPFHTILAAMALSAVPLFADSGTLLCDFESEADVKLWQPLENSSESASGKWVNAPELVAEGDGAMQIATLAAAKTGKRWPGLLLPGTAMKFVDWRAYDELEFQAINPADKDVKLLAMIAVGGGGTETHDFTLHPGKNVVRWKLPAIARETTVANLRFFQNDPTEDVTLYLDSIRLFAGADFGQKMAKLTGRMEKLFADKELNAAKEVQTVAALRDEVRQLEAEVAAGLDLLVAAQRLIALEDRFTVEEKRCHQWLNDFYAARLAKAFPDQKWGYALAHGTRKIFRDEVPFAATPGGTAQLDLAQRETEAFQIVLRSQEPVEVMSYTASDLVDAATGKRIPADAVTIQPVGYVDSPGAAYAVAEKVRWRPDPLLSFLKNFDLDADVWQPLWVEVTAAPETAPGKYVGTVTVNAEGMAPLTVPVEVNVWDFALPLRQSLPNLFTYEANSAHKIYAANDAEYDEFRRFQRDECTYEELSPGAKRLRDLEIATENLLLDHRVSPSSLYLVDRAPRASDVKRWVDRGIACFNIFYVSSVSWVAAGAPYPEDSRKRVLAALEKAIPEYREAGVLPYALIYGFDEVGTNQFAAAQGILGEIKKLYPDIPILTTAFDDSFGRESGLSESVDIWCPLTPSYLKNRDSIEKLRQDEKKFWYYTCCGPLPPSLNLLLEQSASAPRLLLGMRAWQTEAEGFLYYQTTLWVAGTRITKGPLTDHNGRSAYFAFNGDGMVLYPGPEGPLSSIRLKMVRDGLEDYEYLRLLEQVADEVAAGKRTLSEEDAQSLQTLLQVEKAIPGDFETYDESGDEILAYRKKLGDFLNRMAPLSR